MNKILSFVALVAVIALTASPASAMLTPDPAVERPFPGTGNGQYLEGWEASQQVDDLLRNALGPAVTNKRTAPRVAVWDCHVDGNTGTCRGRVVAGTVVCRGLFRVLETTKFYATYPVRMTCGV